MAGRIDNPSDDPEGSLIKEIYVQKSVILNADLKPYYLFLSGYNYNLLKKFFSKAKFMDEYEDMEVVVFTNLANNYVEVKGLNWEGTNGKI